MNLTEVDNPALLVGKRVLSGYPVIDVAEVGSREGHSDKCLSVVSRSVFDKTYTSPIRLGGPGGIIQIDESLFTLNLRCACMSDSFAYTNLFICCL